MQPHSSYATSLLKLAMNLSILRLDILFIAPAIEGKRGIK